MFSIKNNSGFSQFLVLMVMSFLVVSLLLTTKMIQQRQDGRSKATENENATAKISFKIAFKGVTPLNKCLSSLTSVDMEVANITSGKYKSDVDVSIKPILGETNSEGDQVFLASNLILDSQFALVDNFNYLRIKGPNHLASRMCLNNQNSKLDEITSCNIDLNGNDAVVYNFSNYPLSSGDINQDGMANSIDYSILKGNFNSSSEIRCGLEGDLNYDGTVNSIDGNLLKKSLSELEDGKIGTTIEVNDNIPTPTQIKTTVALTQTETIPTVVPTEAEENTGVSIKDPIVPGSYDSKKSAFSDTLKVWTTHYDRYYVVRIWAKNPYLQFHQYSAKMENKTYDTIEGLFNAALIKNANGIKNKIAVAFNSDPSVYYNGYYYCRNSVHKDCPFDDYTSGGLIIREGEIYRNDTTTDGKRNLTYVVTKENKMIVLNEKYVMSSEARAEKFKPAIDGKARNTFSALTMIMDKGKVLSTNYNPDDFNHLSKSDKEGTRNALCQVNENNFIYIIASGKTSSFLKEKMKELGCYVAVNNDGGGSTNFWFKKASDGSWTHIHGGGKRNKMDTVAYWTEL